MAKKMTLRELRNHLELMACYLEIDTIEYKNINRRIKYINNRLWKEC